MEMPSVFELVANEAPSTALGSGPIVEEVATFDVNFDELEEAAPAAPA